MKSSALIYDNLANKNIKSLFWQYALPAVIGISINMMYNIIDGIFIGHWVGPLGLAAAGIILPVLTITAAVGMLVGIGAASRFSIYLGNGDIATAERVIGASLVLTLLLSGSIISLLLYFLEPVLLLSGANDKIMPLAKEFLIYFLPGNIFLSLMFNFNSLMRASGYPLKAMIALIISVICNIILAPLFIIYFDLGMKGAALATVTSMFIGFIFVLVHFLNRQRDIRLLSKNIRFNFVLSRNIVYIGLSPFITQIASACIIIVINHQLKIYAIPAHIDRYIAIGSFSNANRFMMLILMIVIGITQGMQPIIGYNFGAKKFFRVKKTFIYAAKVAVLVTTIGFLASHFIPHTIMAIFTRDPMMLETSTHILKTSMLAYVFIGLPIVIISLFQSINMPKLSTFLSLTRQVIFLIPLLLILPLFLGFDGVLYAIPVADMTCSIISVITLFIFYQNFSRRHRMNE